MLQSERSWGGRRDALPSFEQYQCQKPHPVNPLLSSLSLPTETSLRTVSTVIAPYGASLNDCFQLIARQKATQPKPIWTRCGLSATLSPPGKVATEDQFNLHKFAG